MLGIGTHAPVAVCRSRAMHPAMPTDNDGAQIAMSQSESLPAAVEWVQRLLLGSIGTSIAVLAIAILGCAMLWGRIRIGDGLRTILGCFLLFGAPIVGRGLLGMTQRTGSGTITPAISAQASPVVRPKPPAAVGTNPFDPYQGKPNGN